MMISFPLATRWFLHFSIIALLAPGVGRAAGERINQEGRILGPAPTVSSPVLFNTARADAVVAAMQIMPVDSPWNEDVSRRPRLANSDAMIAQIKADLASSRQTLRPFYEMNFVLVPDGQSDAAVSFFNYPDESDPSPYPIPGNLPIEGWPRETGGLTLTQWQRNVNNSDSDRHAIMVKPGAGTIWETWLTQLTNSGWEASNGAKFDLKSNALRPAGWTSGDAAGLPMFPAVVRHDECERGAVEHAMRLVVKRTRVGPIYPARHQASVGSTTDPNIPAMGQRLRLKAVFIVPDNWTREEKAVLRALKKYGAIVADNGGFFSISVCPDDRFSGTAFDHLSTIGIDNFEVIQSTGQNEGPRSPGAPVAHSGPDTTAVVGAPLSLDATVTGASNGAAVSVGWKFYSGPGTVKFADASKAKTTATFSAPGAYTLMFHANDGVHTVSHDALLVKVSNAADGSAAPTVSVSAVGDGRAVKGGPNGKVLVERTGDMSADLTVSYKVKGTAQAGIDYRPLSGTLTIPAGADRTKIKVKALGNDAHEGARKAKIELLSSTDGSYRVGDASIARIRIVDSE